MFRAHADRLFHQTTAAFNLQTLPGAVRTGRQTFSTAHGTDFWSYLAGHPLDQPDFDQAMPPGPSSAPVLFLPHAPSTELRPLSMSKAAPEYFSRSCWL